MYGCEAAELEAAAEEAPERLAVAGGDGTVGAVAELAGRLDVPLAVIPRGTANDFVRANKLPEDPLAAPRSPSAGARLRRLELGRLGDGRPFANVASARPGGCGGQRRSFGAVRRLGPSRVSPRRTACGRGLAPARDGGAGRRRHRVLRTAWQVIVAVTGAFGGGSGLGAAM